MMSASESKGKSKNMNIRKILLGMTTVVFLATAPVAAAAQENSTEVTTEIGMQAELNSDVPQNGMYSRNGTLVFYENGTPIKNRWRNWKRSRYYFGSNGEAYTGSQKIGSKIYVFNEQGRLLKNKKGKFVTVFGKKYYMNTKAGNPKTGYFVYKKHLYYADSMGRCYQNRYRNKKKYYFTESGYARTNIDTSLKIQAMKTIAKVTTPNMSQSQKLKACWNYLVDGKSFQYAGSDPNRKKKGWYKETALRMLETKRGNCYSFACAFAALAKELGYKKIKLLVGYDHCWVTINGKHYDPQAHFTIWITGIYGLNRHPLGNEVSVYTFA